MTIVILCAGAQIIRHHELWKLDFNSFDFELYPSLSRHMMKKDKVKNKRQNVNATKVYISYRSKKHYNKYTEAHDDQLDDLKTGAQYKNRVTVRTAKELLKSAPKRNPPGTLITKWKCLYYHPKYCKKLGHKDC